jgi:hypothetical protein
MPRAPGPDRSEHSFWRVLGAALATLFIVGELAIGGVWDFLRIPYAREVLTRLGYPIYVLLILGALKVPAAVVLMVPRFGRLKEWAYAGALITYAASTLSHLAVRDETTSVVVPCAFAALTLVSWWLRSPAQRASAHSTAGGKRSVAYWATTLALALACLALAVLAVFELEPLSGIILRLGYPSYFMTILGIGYFGAGVALLVPRSPRLKEWTYAGLVFTGLGAMASHLATGDRVSTLLAPAALLALTVASCVLRPPARRSVSADWSASQDVAFSS